MPIHTWHSTGTDGFGNEVTTGSGEFHYYYNALLRAQTHDLRVDGVRFTPASRVCPGPCSQLDFFYGRRLELIDSRLEPTDGAVHDGGSPTPTGVIEAQSCQVDGTTIESAGTSNRAMIRCGQVAVTKSEVFAGNNGSGVDARDATIMGSVIRGSSSAWSSLDAGVGVLADGCLFTHSSIIAGRSAILSGSRLGECAPDRQGIFETLTHGGVTVSRTRIANSVLLGERSPIVTVVTPTSCETDACRDAMKAGNVVRNNLFIQLQPGGGVATTPLRAANGLPDLVESEINDSAQWFGPFANDIAGNRFEDTLAGVFDTTVGGPGGPVELDPAWRGARGHVFHFAPSYDAAFGIGLSGYGVPAAPTLDLAPAGSSVVGPY